MSLSVQGRHKTWEKMSRKFLIHFVLSSHATLSNKWQWHNLSESVECTLHAAVLTDGRCNVCTQFSMLTDGRCNLFMHTIFSHIAQLSQNSDSTQLTLKLSNQFYACLCQHITMILAQQICLNECGKKTEVNRFESQTERHWSLYYIHTFTLPSHGVFHSRLNPFNASCFKMLLFEVFSTILVWHTICNFWCSGAQSWAPEHQNVKN